MAQRPTIGMPTLSPRAKRVLYVLAALVILAIAWFQFVGFYWNWAWFGEVGFRQVFTTEIVTRIILFVIGFIIPAGLVFGSLVMAYRSRPVFVPTNEVDPLAPYRTVISTRPRLIAIGLSVLVGAVTGVSAQAQWQTAQLWLNSQSFGQVDPQFGHDIGFYIFELPLYRTLITWALIVVGVCFAAVLVVQYLYGGLRVSGPGKRITPQAALQLSLLVGVFVLVKAVAYWFDRYDLLFSDRGGIVTGAGYTDINAVLPAKIILMIIAAICAIGFFVGAFLRSIKLPAIAVALLVLSSVLIGGIWPLIMQQVVVNPNTISREPEFVQRNMDGTRNAFGLTEDKVTFESYEDSTDESPSDLVGNPSASNVRLLDPNILSATFTQRQQLENFYGFTDPLTIDRYEVDGQVRDYVLALRELDANRLRDEQRTWINEHMVYTHGNGLVAAQANTVSDGYPSFVVSDVQTEGPIKVDQPRIYYGELSSDYAIVGQENNDTNIEYDTRSTRYTYTGSGGVNTGGFFDRLIFATHYGEANFLFSTEINGNSKILYNRDPSERVQLAAPFLTLDTKPYPAAVDGRLVWIVDGYTTARNYPYSQPVNLSQATANSQTALGSTQAQIDAQVSYIRNSVKATVDAYDGTVTLYQVDDTDPVLKAWMGVFPDLITPGSEVSDDLRAHFRYPQDLFEVQRSLLTKYHLESPTDLINNANLWRVPDDPTESSVNAAQPPYYQQIELPTQEGTSFQLTSALTGFDRPFLQAYVSAESDPENYGHLTVLQLDPNTQTPGPVVIQQTFTSNQQVANFIATRVTTGTNTEVYGNLLTLPTSQGLLYVEPLYLRGLSANAAPQLGQVLVWFNKRVGIGDTLPQALRAAAASAPVETPVGEDGTVLPPESGEPSTDTGGVPPVDPTTDPAPLPADAEEAYQQMEAANTELEEAKTSGDLVRIAEATDALQQAVDNFLRIAMPSESAAPSAAPSDAPESSGEPTEGG